jgi:hypothetical protein
LNTTTGRREAMTTLPTNQSRVRRLLCFKAKRCKTKATKFLNLMSWLYCHSCPVIAVLPRLSCHDCPALVAIYQLSCPGRHDCPVSAVLSQLSFPASLSQFFSHPCCRVPAACLSPIVPQLLCPRCPVHAVKF